MPRKTAGSVSGTKTVVLRGGPPEWDGQVTAVVRDRQLVYQATPLERWDHTADLAVCYLPSGEVEEVTVSHDRRNGPVEEQVSAEVYAFAGYKEDMQ